MSGSAARSMNEVPRLGIGLPYFASLPAELYQQGAADFVEITPETLCRQRPSGRRSCWRWFPGRWR